MARGGAVRAHARGAGGRTVVGVLRGTAHSEWPPGHPPRLRAHDQGSLLPPSRDAWLSRAAKSGLGHARPAGRDRGREAVAGAAQGARDERRGHPALQREAAHRGVRRRGVQSPLPRERVEVPGRLGEAERADRLLAGLRQRVRHVHERLRGERVVGAGDDARARVARTWPQDPAVLPALRNDVVESRGGVRLSGCE